MLLPDTDDDQAERVAEVLRAALHDAVDGRSRP